MSSAGIISLLTHTCISVGLHVDVHPQHMHISHHTIGDCPPNAATPAVEIPAKFKFLAKRDYKLLAKGGCQRQ